jgi:hypothetical protein
MEPANLFARSARSYNTGSGFPSGERERWDDYVKKFVGVVPRDAGASAVLEHYNNIWDPAKLTYSQRGVFDIILDLEPGWRTNNAVSKVIRGWPLGLLAAILKDYARFKGVSPNVVNRIVFVGKVVRVRNEVVLDTPVPNEYLHQEGVYQPKKLVQRIDEFSLVQFPLSKISFDLPAGLLVSEVIGDSLPVRPFVAGLNQEEPMLFHRPFDLYNYINELSSWEGGSDQSFYLCGDGGYFAKRWHPVTDRSTSSKIRTARPMRTAGLRQVILKSFEFIFGSTNHFYVAGGSKFNCFLDCVRWNLVKLNEKEWYDARFGEFDVLAQDEDLLTEEFPREEAETKAEELIMQIIIQRCSKTTLKNYLQKYLQGFPTSEMRSIALCIRKFVGIRIDLWRLNTKNEWENVLAIPYATRFTIDLKAEICLFQMDDEGHFLNLSRVKTELMKKYVESNVVDGSLGHMLHCVSVYPYPECFKVPKTCRRGLVKDLEDLYGPLLKRLYEKNCYNPDITFEEIDEFVKLQNERYDRNEVHTLIFNPSVKFSKNGKKEEGETEYGEEGGGGGVSSRKRKRKGEAPERDNPRNFVYAYDLETVDNVSSIQNMVFAPFRKVIPPRVVEFYDPIECQIPFSAQWVCVNVDDEGQHLERKLAINAQPIEYGESSYSREDREQYRSIFLSDPITDYGEFELGRCIESFLVEIANDIKDRGGDIGYLYATNGSKFDSYVILQYQRFEISDILKTSRGILFAKLRVPLVKPGGERYDYTQDDSPKVSLILRDISLIVPGSLSRLCKGFDVPKQFCKQDFPIQMVDASNCYDIDIMRVCQEYGECDVLALAFIIKKINILIGNLVWKPATVTSDRPPIVQFLTCMSMIRKSTLLHFQKNLPKNLHPKAVDIPGLRNWIIQAAIGGRVTPYAKSYASPFASLIFKAFNECDTEKLKTIHRLMLASGECMQCLDFTSLYPFTMDSCPMPVGKPRSITVEECNFHIDIMGCRDCDELRTLCSKHRYYFLKNDHNLRPFSIIIVKNVTHEHDVSWVKPLQNLCPRKVYSATTLKCMGLNYSLENNAEYFRRMDGKLKMLDTQAFTNVDLYWMRRQGFFFEIVGGFTWHMSMIYNSFIGPAFQLRIDAKKEGNKLLSDFMKLNYNGAYGITIQQDIDENYFMIRLPEDVRHCDPALDPRVIEHVLKDSGDKSKNTQGFLSSEELTGEGVHFVNGQTCLQKRKKKHLVEFFADQSPMQIGAAILAYARHIGNLVLFNLNPFDYSYTDTDSIALSESVIQLDDNLQKLIMNRDDAPMGSLKNDHLDGNGVNPRIFFSIIGAKKVKGHFTLNEKGEVKVYNTFKGLNVSLDLEGKKMNPIYADYISTKTLLSINEQFTSDPVEVQAWKRDLQNGVSIGNHMQHLEKETYMSDFMAIMKTQRSCGQFEYFIPHGFKSNQIVLPDISTYYVVKDEKFGDLYLNKPREPIWDKYREDLLLFVEKYYEGCRSEYHPGTEEYQKILDLFRQVQEESETPI